MDHPNSRPASLTLEPPVDPGRLKVKIFADGAEIEGIRELYANPLIKGFTTNPTLMHKIGIRDYERFAKAMLEVVPDRPISFEVFCDDLDEMERQATKIASWSDHVYVKIPVTTCAGARTDDLLQRLVGQDVKVNVTGLMTLEQVAWVSASLGDRVSACISVFAGRVADTGVDPVPMMSAAVELIQERPNQELIWASPREVLNIVQADQIGCHIVTVTHDLLKKLPLLGRDLEQFSLDTVRMFRDDAVAAGYTL